LQPALIGNPRQGVKMLVTDRTREALRCRRIRRKLAADGFEETGAGGGNL
jgi:hypothetical protein